MTEIRYAGFGFVLTRREMYLKMQEKLKLPACNPMFHKTITPYFLPFLLQTPQGLWYLGEDYAFCERAYQSGYRLFADTTIRLWHIGSYTYGWEDAGRDVERFGNYTYTFAGATPPAESGTPERVPSPPRG